MEENIQKKGDKKRSEKSKQKKEKTNRPCPKDDTKGKINCTNCDDFLC